MNDDFDVRLGMLLREEREKKGITLQEIADKIGVTKTTVSRWELGTRSMYASSLKDYCKACGIDINEYIMHVFRYTKPHIYAVFCTSLSMKNYGFLIFWCQNGATEYAGCLHVFCMHVSECRQSCRQM